MKNEEWHRKQYNEQRSHNEKQRKMKASQHAEQQASWNAHRANVERSQKEEARKREAHRSEILRKNKEFREEKSARDAEYQNNMLLLRLNEIESRRRVMHSRELVDYIAAERNVGALMEFFVNWTKREAAHRNSHAIETNITYDFKTLPQFIAGLQFNALEVVSASWGHDAYNHALAKFPQYESEISSRQRLVKDLNKKIDIKFETSKELINLNNKLTQIKTQLEAIELSLFNLKSEMTGFWGLFFKESKKSHHNDLLNASIAHKLNLESQEEKIKNLLSRENSAYNAKRKQLMTERSDILSKGKELASTWSGLIENYQKAFDEDMNKYWETAIEHEIHPIVNDIFAYVDEFQFNVSQSKRITIAEIGMWYASCWRGFTIQKPGPRTLEVLCI